MVKLYYDLTCAWLLLTTVNQLTCIVLPVADSPSQRSVSDAQSMHMHF